MSSPISSSSSATSTTVLYFFATLVYSALPRATSCGHVLTSSARVTRSRAKPCHSQLATDCDHCLTIASLKAQRAKLLSASPPRRNQRRDWRKQFMVRLQLRELDARERLRAWVLQTEDRDIDPSPPPPPPMSQPGGKHVAFARAAQLVSGWAGMLTDPVDITHRTRYRTCSRFHRRGLRKYRSGDWAAGMSQVEEWSRMGLGSVAVPQRSSTLSWCWGLLSSVFRRQQTLQHETTTTTLYI